MRLLIRVMLSAVLILADAVQAATVLAAETGGLPADSVAPRYQQRMRGMLEKDASTWKRIVASICSGCGAPLPPSETARILPAYLANRNPEATTQPEPGSQSTIQSASALTQTAAPAKAKVRFASARRYVRARTRITRSVQRRARYALWRQHRHGMRIARLQPRNPRGAPLGLRNQQQVRSPVRLVALQND